MSVDPTAFASADEQRQLQTQLLGEFAGRAFAEPAKPPPDFQRYLEIRDTAQSIMAQPNPYMQRFTEGRQMAQYIDAEDEQNRNDLAHKSVAYQLMQSTQLAPSNEEERQTAMRAVGRASVGALNATLHFLDTPRRWVFENLLIPAARKVGLGEIAQDTAIEPNGRDLFLKATGGNVDRWIADRARQFGLNEPWASLGASGASAGIGLGLDVLFDPVSYLSFGSIGLLKGGGRVLTREGQALMGLLKNPSAAAWAGSRLPEITAALGSPLKLDSPIGKLVAKGVTDAEAAKEAVRLQGIQRRMMTAAIDAGDKLTYPEIDEVFSLLRGTGVQADLFKRGGARWHLPLNSLHLDVPLLNREEQIGLFLGGREVAAPIARRFDELRRTAFDLGEAALAKVPIPESVQKAVGGLAAGGQRLGSWMMVPYYTLQGWGKDTARELFKQMNNVGRVESNLAATITRDITKPLSEAERQRFSYLLGNGAQVPTYNAAGQIIGYETESIGDYVQRANQMVQRIRAEAGLPAIPNPVSGTDFNEVLQQQIERAEQTLRIIAQMPADQLKAATSDVRFKLHDLGPLRDPTLVPAGTDFSLVELVQHQIQQATEQLATGRVPKRYETRELVRELEQAVAARKAGDPNAPVQVTLEMLVPEDSLRTALLQAYQREADIFGHVGVQGPMAANLQMALDAGQETLLMNHLSHIHNVQAPGISKYVRDTLPQMGIRTPGDIGKQRVLTAGAEPELLEAYGYSTNAEAILAKKMAQYRTTAREGEFVRLMLDNYGERWVPGRPYNTDTHTKFNPTDWFSKSLPDTDTLQSQLNSLRFTQNISEPETRMLLSLASGKIGQGEQWVIPKGLDDAFKLNRQITYNAGGMFAWLDGILSIQRNLVTSIWPAYHTRNVIGNVILSHLGGVSVGDWDSAYEAVALLRGTNDSKILNRLTGLITGSDPNAHIGESYAKLDLGSHNVRDWLLKTLEERGVLRGGHAAVDLGVRAPNQNIGTEVLNAVADNPFFSGARNFAEATDNSMRLRHVLGRLKNGDTLEEAILGAKKFLFDYNDLTQFEKNVLRRGAFFYTFLRKNLPLQLEMLVHEPREPQYWNHLFQAMQDPDAQRRADASLLPAWIREQLGMVVMQGSQGRLGLISGLGLPIEDINQIVLKPDLGAWIQRFMGLTHPWIQGALAAAGTPVAFTERPLQDENFQNYYRQLAPLWAELAQKVPGMADKINLQAREIVDASGQPRTLYTADPKVLYALYSFFSLGRAMQTLGRGVDAVREGNSFDRVRFGLQAMTGIHTGLADISRPIEAVHTSTETQHIDQETTRGIEQLATQLFNGKIDPEAWRSRRSDLLARRADQRELLLRQQMAKEGVVLTPQESQAINKQRGAFVDMGTRLLNLYHDIDPSGTNPNTGQPFRNAREWAELRDDVLSTIKQDYPEAAKRARELERQRLAKLTPQAREIEENYQRAKDLLSEYEMVPKYIGLTAEDAAQADEVIKHLRTYARDLGPAGAKARLYQDDPAGYLLARRAQAHPNTRARQQKWRALEAESGNLLSKFFGDLAYQETLIPIGT